MNSVKQIRRWDWRTLLCPQYFCHIVEIVDGNPIENERIKNKNKSPDSTRKQRQQNE